MYDAIKKAIKTGVLSFYNESTKSRNDWIKEHKSQVVATVSQIIWTNST